MTRKDTTVKSIGLVYNVQKESAYQLALEIGKWFNTKHKEIDLRSGCNSKNTEHSNGSLEWLLDVDVLIVLGGDGTVFHWGRATHASKRNPPMLTVNFGTKGFVTDIEPDYWEAAINRLLKGEYVISERVVLQADYNALDGAKKIYALNDIVVVGQERRMVRLDLFVYNNSINDGLFQFNHSGDGIIFATPTGSTAYSLSAGGSILHPNSKVIELTPLNPHGLNSRSLILPDTDSFRIKQKDNSEPLQVIADGQTFGVVSNGDPIDIKKSDKPVRLIQMNGDHFYSKLSNRLEWGREIQ